MPASQVANPESQTPEVSAKSNERFRVIFVGVIQTLILLTLALRFPASVERINTVVTDIQIGLLPETNLSPVPVIVEVDEQSLANYGQWPWPRYQVARLLSEIQKAGASAVGIDALFVERDRTSPLEIQRVMEREFKQTFPIASIDKTLWDYDTIFGQTLKSGPFVISYLFNFNLASPVLSMSCQPKSAGGAWLSANDETSQPQLHQAVSVTCNVPSIQESANASGFINSASDSDGIYRKTPLVVAYNGRFYPSLALQAFLTANALENFLLTPSDTGLALRTGKLQIPLDNAGNLLIKFPVQDQHFKTISAAELLSGKLTANTLKNSIVFVGFSAAGLHEVRPTPYSPQFTGVELHAAIVDNLVRKDFLHRPNNASSLEIAIASVLGLALFIGLANAKPFTLEIIPWLAIVLLFICSQLILANSGMVISPALPVMVTMLALLTLALMKYIGEYIRAKQMAVQVSRSQEGIIGSFCSMSEYRDPETGAHIKRTQEYIRALALHLQNHPNFKEHLTNDVIDLLFKAAPLHDIGKIGIRDHILLKNGRLTEIEFEIMQSHPQIGADIIDSVATQIGWNPFMQIAHQICLSHQEKWDGSGYPQGLAGYAIPLPARFMALADVYDALISKRVYKPAFSHNTAVTLIKEGKNKHFDPHIVDAFLSINEQFRDIALRFLDNEAQKETLLADKE